ncbi:MAG: hypothetical protein JSS02_14985 [Planctomycetes bacterium]|nr:hypothetical protein [Planctomycetota bacterium]
METAPTRTICLFDLTDVAGIPTDIVARLAMANDLGTEIEIVNPSPQFQSYLRHAAASSVLIRGSSVDSP